MKKRFIIILSIQTFLMLLFFVYAVIQKLEADRYAEIAFKNEKTAKEILYKCQSDKKELLEKIDSLSFLPR